jgi:hypothetical protein
MSLVDDLFMAPDEIAVYHDGGLSMLITIARAGLVMGMISGLQHISICLYLIAVGPNNTRVVTTISSFDNLYRVQGMI